jgi:putative DNA primase/helicase
VIFDERATCPRWDKAISEWFPNEDTAKYVQRLAGQAVLGIVRDHILVSHYGGGLNGKGTFTRALARVFGDYATTLDLALLTETRHGPHAASTSVLFRRRLAMASETSRRVRLAEAQVKNLTGGDAIQARRLYENPWQFEPTHSLWLQTNHLPEIAGRDCGIWRRIRIVPWRNSFDGCVDDTLDDALRDEAPGILNWVITGALLYQELGLSEPSEVVNATLEYRDQEDILKHWMIDCGYVFETTLKTQSQTLADSWRSWSESQFGRAKKFSDLTHALENKGCIKISKAAVISGKV